MKQFKTDFKAGYFFIVFILCQLSFAGSTAQSSKDHMNQLLKELTILKTYFVSEDKFLDPKNNAKIATHLKKFSAMAAQTNHDPVMDQQNFKFTQQVLQAHIVETERAFNEGKKSYARWQLASTISLCMSCHTQAPATQRAFSDFNNLKTYSSKFDQAEFLFATRAFEQANQLFNSIIDSYPKNKVSLQQVETALERELTYYARVQRNPDQAVLAFKKYQKNKELPEFLQKNISVWIAEFENWKKQPSIDMTKSTDEQILEYARKNIADDGNHKMLTSSDPTLLTYLRVSGMLYEHLQKKSGSKVVPEILYWLSLCDRVINHNFFYSMADIYLKECIVKYSTTPIAKKCYQEYETQTILGYTGSGGTNVPADVKADLDQLKKLVNSSGKIDLKGH